MEDIIEISIFEQILPAVAQTMICEKKGSGDLVTEFSKIIFKEESSRITKKSIHQVIAWLYHSHIIGYCGKVNNGDKVDALYLLKGNTYGGIEGNKYTVPIYLAGRIGF